VARASSDLEERRVTALVDPEFWARLLGIILIDISLAGDNALVIALAVRGLPPRQQLFGRIWGTVGAVVLRVTFIAVVSALLRIPLLQLAGGLALIWIAVRLVRPAEAGHEGTRSGGSLREAIWIIVVADVTMSLDNVLGVAAAAKGDMVLVVFGIALSLPLVVWGSGLLARLMVRHAWIVWVGGAVLGYVAGEMMANDPVVERWLGRAAEAADQWLSIVLGVFVLSLGWWLGKGAALRGRQRGQAHPREQD
jgi:YjbE family integral membrane protein